MSERHAYLEVPTEYVEELGDLTVLMEIWPRLPKPGQYDWLSVFHEQPQTVQSLARRAPQRAKDLTLDVVIQPVAPLDDPTKSALDTLKRFLQITFQCEVRTNPIQDAPKDAYFHRGRQINAPELLSFLVSLQPDDVWGMAGITSFDLGQEGMNFVFGMSSPATGVSITSNARKGAPRKWLALRRLISTLAHELGHALGMSHCIAFSCMMNGSNHLAESDARPTMFCPHCQAKLRALRDTDPKRVFAELIHFYREHGLNEDKKLAEGALGLLEN